MEDRIEEVEKPKSKQIKVTWQHGRAVKEVKIIQWTNGILRRDTDKYPLGNFVYADLKSLLEDLGRDSSYSELRGSKGPELIRDICNRYSRLLAGK